MKLPPEDPPHQVEEDGPKSIDSQEINSQLTDCSQVITAQCIKQQNNMPSENSIREENLNRTTSSVNGVAHTQRNGEGCDCDKHDSVHVAVYCDSVCLDQDDINSLEKGIEKIELTPKGFGSKDSDKYSVQSNRDNVKSLEEDFQKIELTPKGPGKLTDGGIIAGVATMHNHLSYNKRYSNQVLSNVNIENFPYSNSFQQNNMRYESVAPGRRKRDDDGQQPLKFSSSDGLSHAASEQLYYPPINNTQQAYSMGRPFPCENYDDSHIHDSNQSSNLCVKKTSTNINPSHMSGGSLIVTADQEEDLTVLIDSMNYGCTDMLLPEPNPRLVAYPNSYEYTMNGNDSLADELASYHHRASGDYESISCYPTTQPLPPNQHKNGSYMLYKDHDSFDSNQGDAKSEGYGTESNASPFSEAQNSPESILTHDSPLNSPQSPSNFNSPPPTNLSVQSEDSGIIGSPVNGYEHTQKTETEENGLNSIFEGRQEELSDVQDIIAKDLTTKNKHSSVISGYPKVISEPKNITSQHVAGTLKTNGVNVHNYHQDLISNPMTVGGNMPTSTVKMQQPPKSKPVVIVPQGPQQVILIPVTQPQQQTVLVPVLNKQSKKHQPVKKINRPPREIRPKPMANPPESVPAESPKFSTSEVKNTAEPPSLTSVAPTSTVKQEFPKCAVQPSVVPIKQELPRSSVPSQSVQRQQPETRINLARRCVAGLKTDELLIQDDDKDTYLHVSIYKADKYMMQALLERLERENLQYMMDAKNLLMQTPLYIAVYVNQPEMVRLLIQHNVDVNVYAQVECGEQKPKFQGAIHYAAAKGVEYLATLNQLLTAPDIKLDLPNSEGKTALHCAILAHLRPSANGNGHINSIPIVETLMRSGADPNAQDINSGMGVCGGKTPLMYAVETKDVHLLESMIKLIDPANMPKYLRTSTYNGFTVLRILESLKSSFREETWMYIRNLFCRTDRQENGVKLKT